MNASRRRIIFVLGMHRSGTSLATGILQALGVSLGDELIPPDENNRLGYFESPTIGRIHDRLLHALGSSWYDSMIVRPLPAQWWRSPQVQPFKRELRELVEHQLDLSGGLWAFKDPRTCRLLPLWRDIAAEAGAQSDFLLVVRRPEEVARSLETRDGLSPLRCEMLWLEHTAEAILNAPSCLNVIADYDRWFTDGGEQAREIVSGLRLEAQDSGAVAASLAKMVAIDLRHHKASSDGVYRTPLTPDLYRALIERDRERAALLAQIFSVSRGFSAAAITLAQEPEPTGVTAGD